MYRCTPPVMNPFPAPARLSGKVRKEEVISGASLLAIISWTESFANLKHVMSPFFLFLPQNI